MSIAHAAPSLLRRLRVLAQLAGATLCAVPAHAGEVRLAVATNFAQAIDKLKPIFEASTGHRLIITTGSTGKLYAQVKSGAPFDVLLAADAQTPQRLIDEGDAVAASRFTYALGQLVLWSATPGRVGTDGAATLRALQFRHLVVANPQLAPYGAAARDALRALGVWDSVQAKLAYAQNIGHAYSMVASGNAELGLLALSQVRAGADGVRGGAGGVDGSSWPVPAALHAPIRQDAVLLTHGQANDGARAFLEALKSPQTRRLIESFGYAVEYP
ncbi:MAG: molybdate ABC transporter substrate-binding protein [Burkholderiaceae bacterium]